MRVDTPGGPRDVRMELVDVAFDAGADVESTEVRGLRGAQVGGDDVVDVDVVAGLAAVPVDDGVAAVQQTLGEDRHHPRLAVRILPRSVDVGVAQRHELEAVNVGEDGAVALAGQLGGAVRRRRRAPVGLGGRQHIGVAVERATARREHHPADPGAHAGIEHVDGAEHVDPGVEDRVADGATHVDLRGEVEHDIGRHRGDHRRQALAADVDMVEGRRGSHLVTTPTRQVVDHAYLRAVREQRVDQRRADEPGASRDQRPQRTARVSASSRTRGRRTWVTANTTAPTATTLP